MIQVIPVDELGLFCFLRTYGLRRVCGGPKFVIHNREQTRSMSASAILFHVAAETFEVDRGAAHYALGLAAAFEAHLTGLVFPLDMMAVPKASRAGAAAVPDDTVGTEEEDLVRRIDRFGERARALGVAIDLRTTHSHAFTVPHVVTDHAKLCDLMVAGVRATGLLSERVIAEHALFQSGRPVIVVPPRYDRPYACERIVVSWDFSRAAARALADASPILQRAKEVTLLTVDADKRIDTSLSNEYVIESLHRRGITVRLQQIERQGRSVGDVIQQHAVQQGAQLLVMGGYGHSRVRDFVLGGATRQILDAPLLPVLLSH